MIPTMIPRTIEMGIAPSCIRIFVCSPPYMPKNTVNRTITKTSSNEEAPRIIVGIAFLAPRPRSIKSIIRGTTTAGETAAKMEPRMAASRQVIFSSLGATSITPPISKTAGNALIITVARPTRFKASRRSSNPALSRMTISAIFLKSPETFIISGDIKFNT